MGIAGAARLVLRVGKPRTIRPTGFWRSWKCNIAAASPSLVYSIAESANKAPVAVWHGVSSLTADDLAAARDDEDGATGGLRDEIEGVSGNGCARSDEPEGRDGARADAGYSDRSVDRVGENHRGPTHRGRFGADRVTMWSFQWRQS